MKRVSVGETISYSSGGRSQPEPEDGLVQRARRWVAIVDAKPTEEWIRGYVLDGINYVEDLCDALEGEEKEVERLRQLLVKRERKIASVDREILRLWRLVNDTERRPLGTGG